MIRLPDPKPDVLASRDAVIAGLRAVLPDEEAVIAYTREHLANFKAPRSVRFVDSLPRNAGGKVVKPQLRELG